MSARGDGRELGVEVLGEREDAAHERPRRASSLRSMISRISSLGRRRGSPRRRSRRRWWRRAGRTAAWRRIMSARPRLDASAAQRARPRRRVEARGARRRAGRRAAAGRRRCARARSTRVADRLAHAPDLALAALVDGDLEHARADSRRTCAGAVRPSSSSTPSRSARSAGSRHRRAARPSRGRSWAPRSAGA